MTRLPAFQVHIVIIVIIIRLSTRLGAGVGCKFKVPTKTASAGKVVWSLKTYITASGKKPAEETYLTTVSWLVTYSHILCQSEQNMCSTSSQKYILYIYRSKRVWISAVPLVVAVFLFGQVLFQYPK